MIVNKEYIIFFWIMGLVIFTFYCIFRLRYISERYDDIPYNNLTEHNKDIITYINNIQLKDKVSDLPGCENLYDDNLYVKSLGYENCSNAFSDYLSKNLNVNDKYENTKSLADICPISTNSRKYNKCILQLLNKFSDNATILENVNIDMNKSINKRLRERSNLLYNIETSINPFIYSKTQTNFNDDMIVNGHVSNYTDNNNSDKLRLINNYYQDRYIGGGEAFTSINTNDVKNIKNEKFTNIVDANIEMFFFGKYKPIGGQFLALNDIVLSIEYDLITNHSKLLKHSYMLEQEQINNNYLRSVIFTIKTNNLFIIYKISRITNYKKHDNMVQLILGEKNIVTQLQDDSIVDHILTMLGIYSSTSLILVFDSFISSESITHTTYKLVNDNLDTILVLDKMKN